MHTISEIIVSDTRDFIENNLQTCNYDFYFKKDLSFGIMSRNLN